jgi:alkyl hydroperoxide reductase subunit D
MTLEDIRDSLPDYARDLKLNLGTVLTPAGAPGLSERQIWAVALAAAAASRHSAFTREIEALSLAHLDAAHVQAAHAAAAIMGMNNVYYRFLHLVEDEEYKQLPARLRMNVIGNPGIDKFDFELLVARRVGDQRLRYVRGGPRTCAAASTASAAKRYKAPCASRRPCTPSRACPSRLKAA